MDLNRQITATVVAELAVGGLSSELTAIIAARDLIGARLSRLDREEQGGR